MTLKRDVSDARRAYHLDARFAVDPGQIQQLRDWCSSSGVYRYVGPRERLRRHTLRGVAGMAADVLLPDDVIPDLCYVLEIGRKADSYEHHVRWRLTARTWRFPVSEGRTPDVGHPGPGRLRVEEEEDGLVVLAQWYSGGFWAQKFRQNRYLPETGDRRNILLWHYEHWYRFLPADDVHALADYWSILPHTSNAQDIVVLNRTASAALYDLAIQLGWRKLTLREKHRLGLDPDGPQWQRADRIAALTGTCQGIGEYTQRAALGDRQYVRTAHGLVESE